MKKKKKIGLSITQGDKFEIPEKVTIDATSQLPTDLTSGVLPFFNPITQTQTPKYLSPTHTSPLVSLQI